MTLHAAPRSPMPVLALLLIVLSGCSRIPNSPEKTIYSFSLADQFSYKGGGSQYFFDLHSGDTTKLAGIRKWKGLGSDSERTDSVYLRSETGADTVFSINGTVRGSAKITRKNISNRIRMFEVLSDTADELPDKLIRRYASAAGLQTIDACTAYKDLNDTVMNAILTVLNTAKDDPDFFSGNKSGIEALSPSGTLSTACEELLQRLITESVFIDGNGSRKNNCTLYELEMIKWFSVALITDMIYPTALHFEPSVYRLFPVTVRRGPSEHTLDERTVLRYLENTDSGTCQFSFLDRNGLQFATDSLVVPYNYETKKIWTATRLVFDPQLLLPELNGSLRVSAGSGVMIINNGYIRKYFYAVSGEGSIQGKSVNVLGSIVRIVTHDTAFMTYIRSMQEKTEIFISYETGAVDTVREILTLENTVPPY